MVLCQLIRPQHAETSSKHEPMRALGSESGVVLLEWALVAGGLILGFLLFRDTVAALNDYMVLTQLAHEGTRIISRIPELETGQYTDSDLTVTDAERQECELALSTSAPCGHVTVQTRLRAIVPFAGLSGPAGDVHFTTRYNPSTAAAAATDDTVATGLSTTFRGFIIPVLTIRATSQSAYLFEGP